MVSPVVTVGDTGDLGLGNLYGEGAVGGVSPDQYSDLDVSSILSRTVTMAQLQSQVTMPGSIPSFRLDVGDAVRSSFPSTPVRMSLGVPGFGAQHLSPMGRGQQRVQGSSQATLSPPSLSAAHTSALGWQPDSSLAAGSFFQDFVKLQAERDFQLRKEALELRRETLERDAAREERDVVLRHESEQRLLEFQREERVCRETLAHTFLEASRFGSNQSSSSSVAKPRISFPTLKEGERVDVYLETFKSLGDKLRLSDEELGVHLLSHLTGVARDAVAEMSSAGFQEMADHLRRHFQMTAEQYRVQFRACARKQSESWRNWASRLSRLLKNWDRLATARDWTERLQLERFCEVAGPDLRQRVLERKFSTLEEAINYAEDYESSKRGGQLVSMANSSAFERSNLGGKSSKLPAQGTGLHAQMSSHFSQGRRFQVGRGNQRFLSTSMPPHERQQLSSSINCLRCGGLGHTRRLCPSVVSSTQTGKTNLNPGSGSFPKSGSASSGFGPRSFNRGMGGNPRFTAPSPSRGGNAAVARGGINHKARHSQSGSQGCSGSCSTCSCNTAPKSPIQESPSLKSSRP